MLLLAYFGSKTKHYLEYYLIEHILASNNKALYIFKISIQSQKNLGWVRSCEFSTYSPRFLRARFSNC